MAFATTNVQRNVEGKLNVAYGDWTGSAGDAAGTFKVSGGRVYGAQFLILDSGNPAEAGLTFNESTSGQVTTISVTYERAVTKGRFWIKHA